MKNLLLFLILISASCQWIKSGHDESNAILDSVSAPADSYTERYAGVLPCADCPGLVTQLTLSHAVNKADGVFTLKETYLDRNVTNITTGNWNTFTRNGNDSTLVFVKLYPGKDGQAMNYLRTATGELLSCGSTEAPPENTKLDFSLHLLTDIPKPFTGTLESLADDCHFTDSLSGISFTIDRSLLYSYLKSSADFHKVHSDQSLSIKLEGIANMGRKTLLVTNVTDSR